MIGRDADCACRICCAWKCIDVGTVQRELLNNLCGRAFLDRLSLEIAGIRAEFDIVMNVDMLRSWEKVLLTDRTDLLP